MSKFDEVIGEGIEAFPAQNQASSLLKLIDQSTTNQIKTMRRWQTFHCEMAEFNLGNYGIEKLITWGEIQTDSWICEKKM